MLNIVEKKIELRDGRTITLETGRLAKQADGSVVVTMGKTMLLAAVVAAKEAVEGTDFMPLSVEYKEKFASSGRIPGGFLKRETRPSDSEILVSRLVDRALRPLFPDDYHAETFVTINLISADRDIIPDGLAGLAASAALTISDIPFHGPISEVRVGRINGEFKINPNFSEMVNSDIDIMVGATYDNILMIEGEMSEISEQEMVDAINFAHAEIKTHCKAQLELAAMLGNKPKREYNHEVKDEQLQKDISDKLYAEVYKIAKNVTSKKERANAFDKLKEDYLLSLPEEERDTKKPLVDRYYHDVEKEAMRNMILNEKVRLDGRGLTDIRPIWCQVDYLPAVHGSAIFTRGETQSLTTVTLGTKLDEKIVDEALVQGTEKFVLHYNFPPYSTGDARPARSISRREIGHGNLAYRALKRMVPDGPDNPYAVRVVSDILESNGSSSMATVCAGTLALMDAGIKIKKPVSGIAMGLITDKLAQKGDFKNGKYAILSDILGDEDHLGDMDFKVTGTKDGITACQMDIKVEGLTTEVMLHALEQAKQGRLFILSKLLETIAEPRAELKPFVPRIVQIIIPKDMIGAVIGPGGKVIQEMQKETGTTIIIEEIDNHGVVDIFGESREAIDAALRKINGITEIPEIGKIYKGKVKSIVAFGAFVEILPGKQGLLHISEIEWHRVNEVKDILKEGQEVEVKLIDIEKGSGKYKLSRKALLPKPEGVKNKTEHSRS